jgi:hypothetical protein
MDALAGASLPGSDVLYRGLSVVGSICTSVQPELRNSGLALVVDLCPRGVNQNSGVRSCTSYGAHVEIARKLIPKKYRLAVLQ